MSKKPRLSKNLLQMKFMQQSKGGEEQEIVEIVQQKLKRKSETVRRGHGKATYRIEPSYGALEDLVFGRMSFQGFNPEVERWMAHYAALRDEKIAKSVNKGMKKDITDAEVAASLSNVSRTINRLFAKKRQRAEMDDDDIEGDEEEAQESASSLRIKSVKRFRRPVDT